MSLTHCLLSFSIASSLFASVFQPLYIVTVRETRASLIGPAEVLRPTASICWVRLLHVSREEVFDAREDAFEVCAEAGFFEAVCYAGGEGGEAAKELGSSLCGLGGRGRWRWGLCGWGTVI